MRAVGHRRHTWVVLALLCTPALSGCTWFGGGNAGLASSRIVRDVATDFGAEQLAAGRAALAAGRTSEAIDAFMIARLYPQLAAEAHNGLAVAYSQLGRNDLTETFFRTAIALAPSDERFQANLARFYERNGISRTARLEVLDAVPESLPTTNEEAAQVSSGPRAVATASAPEGLVASSPGSRLRRVSAREVMIVRPAAAPVAAQLRPYRSTPLRTTAARQPYPIRIAFPEPRSAANEPAVRAITSRARSHPVRIMLPEPEKARITIEGRRAMRSASQG
jgi:tetratricopeptide (TPR) repeat protein